MSDRESGSILVEFMGALALLLASVLAVAQVAAWCLLRSSVAVAADAGARAAAVHGPDSPQVHEAVLSRLYGRVDPGEVSMIAQDLGAEVEVSVRVDRDFVFLPGTRVTSSSTRLDERDLLP